MKNARKVMMEIWSTGIFGAAPGVVDVMSVEELSFGGSVGGSVSSSVVVSSECGGAEVVSGGVDVGGGAPVVVGGGGLVDVGGGGLVVVGGGAGVVDDTGGSVTASPGHNPTPGGIFSSCSHFPVLHSTRFIPAGREFMEVPMHGVPGVATHMLLSLSHSNINWSPSVRGPPPHTHLFSGFPQIRPECASQ